jgi:hypothetical protein
MKHTGAIWAWIDQACRRRRDHRAHLNRAILVAYVEDPNSSVLIGSEDQFRADEAFRAVLMNVVRAEMSAHSPVIGI